MKIKNNQKILGQLESISSPLSEHEIFDKIGNFIKENFKQNPPETLIWEQMAFVLPDSSKIIEYLGIHKITPEVISYWGKRAKESKHPILKARYSNLVWDFSEPIKGEKPHYSIAQIFIDSAIEIAEKDLHKYEVDTIEKLKRALSLALSINDKERINKLVSIIMNYEEKIAKDDKRGLWGFSYELLIKDKKLKLDDDKELKIINNLKDRFERLLNKANHFAIQRAALLLVDYYSKHGEKGKVKDILTKFGELVQKRAKETSALVGSTWLENLYHLYLEHGLKDETNEVSNMIRKLGQKAKSELKEHKVSVEIPAEEVRKIREYINWLTDGDLKTVLAKIAVNYIPKKNEAVNQLQDLSKKAPIQFLFPQRIMDDEGRVIATVGSLEGDIDGHIILQISQNMEFSSSFLRETLNAFINKFNLSTTDIMNYLYESPIFDERRKDFFIKGINAYLNEDFLISLHLLIPQVEALIRNLAEKIGIPILEPAPSGGFYYRTLDKLLGEKAIIKVLSEDICLYLRVLLTDPRGWNLRNNICHGISKHENFNQITADRIFHALLCLALVKEQEKKE
ncbi:MAG: DUF4209 domain-containing protein [Thermotogae bacterium]|nr:DUF4209 domain-containing protein [Thermotogota bacterium]